MLFSRSLISSIGSTCLVGLLAAAPIWAGGVAACSVETVAGGGETPIADGVPALEVKLTVPRGIGIGAAGELLLTDAAAWRVMRLAADGTIELLAGSDTGELRQSGVPAKAARIAEPVDVTVGPSGDVLIVERVGNQVRRINADGLIQAFAGSGETGCNGVIGPEGGLCGDGGAPSQAQTPLPRRIAVDSNGVVHILHDFTGSRAISGPWLRRVYPDGRIDTLPFHLSLAELKESIVGFAIGPDGALVAHTSFPGADFYRLSPEGVATAIPDGEGLLVNSSGALAVGPDGSVYHAGGTGAVHRVAPDGRLSRITGLGSGYAGDGGPAFDALFRNISDLAIDGQGDLYIADSGNGRVRRIRRVADCPSPLRPWIAHTGTVEAASYAYALSPGALFAVFGRNLGASTLVSAQLDEQGRFPTELTGTRILVDGIPAPLVFASSGQVNAIVPWSVQVGTPAGPNGSPPSPLSSRVVVERGGEVSDAGFVSMPPTSPGLFTLDSSGDGQAAALNQDNSINGSASPAAPGEIVVFFGTGGGLTTSAAADGAIAAGPAALLADVQLHVNFMPVEILYAGSAPGLVEGVVQINARLPEATPTSNALPVDLWIGGVQSIGDPTIAVAP